MVRLCSSERLGLHAIQTKSNHNKVPHSFHCSISFIDRIALGLAGDGQGGIESDGEIEESTITGTEPARGDPHRPSQHSAIYMLHQRILEVLNSFDEVLHRKQHTCC
jgi:hypothetical protein